MSAQMDKIAVVKVRGKSEAGFWWADSRFVNPGLYWSGFKKTFRILPWRYRRVPRG